MKPLSRFLIAACVLILAGAAAAQTERGSRRFETFAGSSANADSLVSGLRTSTQVTLKGSGETATFTPPTRPMGYGNVTRALDLAQRELAAAGISNPSPTEIKIAMMGGTIRAPDGDVQFAGVLQLRSEGMGWGQIAHAIGVHPGMGKSAATPVPASSAVGSGFSSAGAKSGIVNAGGGSPVANGNGRALHVSGGTSVAKGQGNANGHAGK